ncbi:hypothetical protein LCGC14_1966480 [marine sediment metagenome]|uniref:Uncharacterized protein n=1 Tax=marine sediment metagenome TaxID=412755 RepID=A0A0F9G1E5_9ZZZZ
MNNSQSKIQNPRPPRLSESDGGQVKSITVPVNSPFIPESLKARIRTEGNVIHVTQFSKAERQVMRTDKAVDVAVRMGA